MTESKSKKISSFTEGFKFFAGIISWVVLVLLMIIAGLLFYYYIAQKVYSVKGEDYRPAFSLYTIVSPSMVPNINVYDVVVNLRIDNPEDIKEGDIITFVSTSTLSMGKTITHRVTQVIHNDNGYSYVTKGDANVSPDGSPALYSNVIGKVAFKIPQLGRLQEFLGTKGGWLIVVVIPALCVIISDLLKIYRLNDAKHQIANYALIEDRKRRREATHKALVEKRLVRRYTTMRKPDDPMPLPYFIYTLMGHLPKQEPKEVIKNENPIPDLPMKVDLPKMLELPKKEEESKPVTINNTNNNNDNMNKNNISLPKKKHHKKKYYSKANQH